MRQTKVASIAGLILILTLSACSSEPENISLDQLAGNTHFHGVAFDGNDSEQLYLATHHGFYKVGNDGLARQVSRNKDDYMGFTPHPTDPETLYASGHPHSGGNLGVMVSTDKGNTWSQRSKGVDGPVDFHQMTVSKADGDVIYGVYHGQLQASHNAGHQWEVVAQAPQELIDITTSAFRVNYLYAATKSGIQMSSDTGKSWRYIHPERQTVSMVKTSAEGDLYAFMVGVGLLHSREGSFEWQVINEDFSDGYLLHLDIDPSNSERLVAIDHQSRILISENSGRDWEEVSSK